MCAFPELLVIMLQSFILWELYRHQNTYSDGLGCHVSINDVETVTAEVRQSQ